MTKSYFQHRLWSADGVRFVKLNSTEDISCQEKVPLTWLATQTDYFPNYVYHRISRIKSREELIKLSKRRMQLLKEQTQDTTWHSIVEKLKEYKANVEGQAFDYLTCKPFTRVLSPVGDDNSILFGFTKGLPTITNNELMLELSKHDRRSYLRTNAIQQIENLLIIGGRDSLPTPPKSSSIPIKKLALVTIGSTQLLYQLTELFFRSINAYKHYWKCIYISNNDIDLITIPPLQE